MIHLFSVGPAIDQPVNMGLIEVDIDPLAERYIVMDRANLSVLWHGVPPEGNAKIRVPLNYTFDYNLMVLVIDDAGSPAYYVTGNDKMQAALVDARTVTLNP
ncbi:MAG: hypothetical protein CVV11_19805 [Gammaproteobacteria bacterium HGW-Gammaproteobacteria-15]|nr:MAG: hypothetical protein CVV11_19805 [Gammaproteobacteria bacterium HGW-Gammaproteobacteria-15]